MSRGLWEIVRAEELNVGDTFCYGTFTDLHAVKSVFKNRVAVYVNETHRLASGATIFRRIPDDKDARVLRRLLDNIARDAEWSCETVARWIEETRMELESEAGDE